MNYILFCFIALNIVACTSQKECYTQEQLYEKMSSGVVLIQNTYYYKISNEKYRSHYMLTTKNGYICHYFCNYDYYDYHTVDSINANFSNTLYGTGFFLNNKETIVTNSHVINPKIDTIQLCNSIEACLVSEIKERTEYLETAIENRSCCIRKLANNISLSNIERKFFNISDDFIRRNREVRDKLLKELQDEDFINNYKVGICERIGVALNGSKISSNESFWSFVVEKDVPNYDLGIIVPFELESFAFRRYSKNYKNRYVFKLPNETNKNKNNEELKLYMIGFNRGPNLALTNEGIKAQITQGNISQNTDSIKIMYSIPALPGSSGSPVVNQYGELVAVNFAGISTTQGFNYGIKVERLKEILDDTKHPKKY